MIYDDPFPTDALPMDNPDIIYGQTWSVQRLTYTFSSGLYDSQRPLRPLYGQPQEPKHLPSNLSTFSMDNPYFYNIQKCKMYITCGLSFDDLWINLNPPYSPPT
ncbi:hypothetical protein VE01_10733 [Pseudogymnoascus verrucosus]|uniref:Uncharacterized protein n=1 Tax=Pseudogymnoascus verrucosus TaxID=342668 RepID=A0A2P6FGR7_9PEZI|nr:uncharacterized protein VE01_10733 [Pseudogymnoascus verrucosus]PQM43837.1 hypothetical protein VE01_10733 [Pseudogymnoascus verrucosus]